MRLFLLENGCDIHATQDEKYLFVIGASKGELHFEEIKSWLTNKLKRLE